MAAYFTAQDEWATVVVTASDGAVVAEFEFSVTLPSANGAWLDSGHLLLLDDEDFTVSDLSTQVRAYAAGDQV